MISISEKTIAQTPGITANIVPSEHPVDVPVSLSSPLPLPPQYIEVVVPEPEKKAEEKLAEMVEVAGTPKVELQVKVEELKKMPTIEEVQVETQEKARKIEEEVPMESKVEAVEEMVEKSKTSESVAQSPPVVTPPNFSPKLLIQSRQSNGPRCMASRRARMGALATFGEKAKAFDAL